ncbi:MAG: FKBP-type peptidyl-prolyl cis-trans isomerase [Cytophagales bacterium]|nr:FKBP-type peptidyl-prolyl cis-trans isomerase [Cytophagales bacterium]
MIKRIAVLALCLGLFSLNKANSQTLLNNELDSLSYAIGVSVGQSLKAQNVEPNLVVLQSAISDVLSSSDLVISANECGMFIQNYFQREASKVMEANAKLGEEFLAKNKTREGVNETESGLQYEVLKVGEGPKPTASNKEKVHYHGTLIDGTVFDSSVERGAPATFGVTQVIKGWVEALQMMPTGSKWKLYIPADLAYGPRGQGQIGPNSTLIFDVELLEIVN